MIFATSSFLHRCDSPRAKVVGGATRSSYLSAFVGGATVMLKSIRIFFRFVMPSSSVATSLVLLNNEKVLEQLLPPQLCLGFGWPSLCY